MGKIHVLHENAEWVVPLETALHEQDLPHELWFLDEGSVDLAVPPPEGVFYNRMSASSHTRGHRFAPELTHVVLNWLERHGRRVVNSSRALYLEISKVAQYAALERAGVRSRARSPRSAASGCWTPRAASSLTSRFILKPNRGGKGLGVQLFTSIDALAAFLDAPGEAAPIDGVWLVQEYVAPRRPSLPAAEFIGGRFFYAVEVDASQGFELCPADLCALDDAFCRRQRRRRPGSGSSTASIIPILERYASFPRQQRHRGRRHRVRPASGWRHRDLRCQHQHQLQRRGRGGGGSTTACASSRGSSVANLRPSSRRQPSRSRGFARLPCHCRERPGDPHFSAVGRVAREGGDGIALPGTRAGHATIEDEAKGGIIASPLDDVGRPCRCV